MRVNLDVIVNTSLDSAGVAVANSDIIDLQHAWGYSVHAKWTKTGGGVLAGTSVLYKSNDKINWILVSTDVIGNATGAAQQEKTDVVYGWSKVIVTLTGGTADVYVTSYSKGA